MRSLFRYVSGVFANLTLKPPTVRQHDDTKPIRRNPSVAQASKNARVGQTKSFEFPDDIPRVRALGGRTVWKWKENEIVARLDYLEAMLHDQKCPGLHGEQHVKDGRVSYETVPLPKDLSEHARDLGEALRRCRELLDNFGVEAAGERMDAIDLLVADIAKRADPDRRDGKKFREGRRKPRRDTMAKAIDHAFEAFDIDASADQILRRIDSQCSIIQEIDWKDKMIYWRNSKGHEKKMTIKTFQNRVSDRRKKNSPN